MKRNLLNMVWLRVMMIVAVMITTFAGTTWAQQQDVVYKSINFASCTRSGYVTENTNTWMATNSDFKVILTNFCNSSNGSSYLNYIACGRAVYSSVASITTAAAIDKPITKVAVTISQISNTSRINSITLQTSEDYVTWTNAGTIEKSQGEKIVELTTPTANLFYRIVVNTSFSLGGWSDNYVRITKVEYYREPDDPNAVKTPVISNAPNNGYEPMFDPSTTVTISCATTGATILYSKDGGTTWIDYNDTPFTLTESTTIKAKATKDNMNESQIASKSFSLASQVKDVTWDLEKSTHSSSNNNGVTWSTDFAVMTLAKGGSTANANDHLGQSGGTYFYNGQMLKIVPIDGYTIVSVDIIVSGNATDLKSDAWSNATTSASGTTLTVTPEDGTMPVSVVCTAGNSVNLLNEVTENYRTIKDVTVHYAPTSLPYIAVANNVLEVTSAETSGTIELVYNKVTPSEVAVNAYDANGTVTWITPSINNTTGKLEYTIAANTTTAERTAEIWVHCEKAEVTVTVTQAAAIPVTIAWIGYSSLYYSDKNLIVPTDVEAYTYKEGDIRMVISHTYNEGDVIPAGTAVILKGEPDDYAFAESNESGFVDGENKLQGSDDKAWTEPGTDDYYYYVLSIKKNSNDASTVGFYWNNSTGGKFENAAHKAYLALPKTSSVKSYYLFSEEDDPTGIEDVNVNLNDNESIYNVAGQRLNKMQKGINIINGKKILK